MVTFRAVGEDRIEKWYRIDVWLLANRELWAPEVKARRYLKITEVEPWLRALIDKARAEKIYSPGTSVADTAYAITRRIAKLKAAL